MMELQTNVRRAKQLAEKYGVHDVNPTEFCVEPSSIDSDFDKLLSQIK